MATVMSIVETEDALYAELLAIKRGLKLVSQPTSQQLASLHLIGRLAYQVASSNL